jgi:plasmid stabilization system protein ParE
VRSFRVRNYLVFYQAEDRFIIALRVLHGARNIERLFEDF